ncbi:uncharacterized protein BX664DRAFT_335265 [Halteromyces radiatus]|uniref:uncharacterized protein n=1 Tax=Halteromyces radiatus TaxID=101107 RepID=UPI00221FB1C9|nr:uncharacterized protein BX664DRAFT_335265 [Halteromyces radiatus]KAI8086236.1 hypothetical protein BX664DRAFT_335265 [Halteromyces radiatus]
MSLAVLNPQEELNHGDLVVNHNQHRRHVIKKKVIAIGKMSKHFSVLREHSNLVTELKQLNGGKLPLGILAQGEQGLLNAITKFKTENKTFKQQQQQQQTLMNDAVEQKDRSLQHIIIATPNTKVAREGQV